MVSTLDGVVVGSGRAGAGNPVTVAPETARANVAKALREALSNVDGVGYAVIGAAGSVRAEVLRPVFERLLVCPTRVVGDVVVAFAAGTTAPVGSVLIAGTGAVAANINGLNITRVGDGLGPLLGDLGSGFWIGRAAATHAARQLQRGARDLLTDLVTSETDHEVFVTGVHDRPPGDLAKFAPLVTEAAERGDPAARSIVDDAARQLAATVMDIREPGDSTPIVLSGSVLLRSAPVLAAVRARLTMTEINLAKPGEIGAARLAVAAMTQVTPAGGPARDGRM